jgi:hypothetical protein
MYIGQMFERGTIRRWRTTEDIPWEVGAVNSGYFEVIPAGTEFESSVPWLFRWIIDRDDPKLLLAALVHDYLLETGVYGPAQAAAEWYDGALAAGAPKWKAKLIYVGIAIWAVYGGSRDG